MIMIIIMIIMIIIINFISIASISLAVLGTLHYYKKRVKMQINYNNRNKIMVQWNPVNATTVGP